MMSQDAGSDPRRPRDPVEAVIYDALCAAKIGFTLPREPGHVGTLDFYIAEGDYHIEVKQFHSARIAVQMARYPNVIGIQGMGAARAFAHLISQQLRTDITPCASGGA